MSYSKYCHTKTEMLNTIRQVVDKYGTLEFSGNNKFIMFANLYLLKLHHNELYIVLRDDNKKLCGTARLDLLSIKDLTKVYNTLI